MPVYHFTLHSYRSWNADNPRGFIRTDLPGMQPPHARLARVRDGWAKHPPVEFDRSDQRFLVRATCEAAAKRAWELLGVTVTTTHVHAVIAVRDWRDPLEMQGGLKSGLGFQLAKRHATRGRPYFSHGGVPERVKDIVHLRYLFETYFPKHGAPMWTRAIVGRRWEGDWWVGRG
jgi:hypothetical protein